MHKSLNCLSIFTSLKSFSPSARRAVMTGMNQLTGKVQEDNADKLGTDKFEVSWHGTARPEHQEWQGKVYTKEQLASVCGLGSVTGLLGANCRHTYFPFIEGVSERIYTDEQLRAMNERENEPKYYNGKPYTSYEATQWQRHLETSMRAQRQKIKLLEEAGADEQDITLVKCKYRRLSQEYTAFSKQMGLPQERDRIYADGLGKIDVKIKEVSIAKNENSDIIKDKSLETISSIELPIEQKNTGKGNPNAILQFARPLNRRQQYLLEQLPEFNDRVIVPKKNVNMKDLAALTAVTGSEFAMFTKGNVRLIIRGNSRMVQIDSDGAIELAKMGYRWSGHTHPGDSPFVLSASDGDKLVLKRFNQENSAIYNSKGQYNVFGKE